MMYIKKFIDKVSYMDSKMSKDVILPITEARYLRDELSKLLLDLHEIQNKIPKKS
jgi:hypothetical protein